MSSCEERSGVSYNPPTRTTRFESNVHGSRKMPDYTLSQCNKVKSKNCHFKVLLHDHPRSNLICTSVAETSGVGCWFKDNSLSPPSQQIQPIESTRVSPSTNNVNHTLYRCGCRPTSLADTMTTTPFTDRLVLGGGPFLVSRSAGLGLPVSCVCPLCRAGGGRCMQLRK